MGSVATAVKPTERLDLKVIRTHLKKAEKAEHGIEATVATSFLVMFVWPIVQISVYGDWIMSIVAGIGGGIVMFFSAAILAGLLEAMLSRKNLDIYGWLIVSSLATWFWWSLFEGRVAPTAILFTTAIPMCLLFYRKGKKGSKSLGVLRELPRELVQSIATGGELPAQYTSSLNAALGSYSDIYDTVQHDLVSDTVVDRKALLADATATLREMHKRTGVLGRMQRLLGERSSPELQEAFERSQGQLKDLETCLHDAREAVLIYAVSGQKELASQLEEQAERLRLTAQSMQELDAELEDDANVA